MAGVCGTVLMVPVAIELQHTKQPLGMGSGWSWAATVVDHRSGNDEVILEGHELFATRQEAQADAIAALQRKGHGS